MPESQEAPQGSSPPGPHGRRRVRRHRHRPLLVRFWWVVPVVVFVAMAPWIWNLLSIPRFKRDPLPGYITDPAKLEEEYLQFTGKPLEDAAATQQFEQATSFMLLGNYSNAVILLESTSRQAAVPVVFNNLGVLYRKLKDGPHAIKAFRDALARNHEYQPVRANLKNMNLGEAAEPSPNEVEPNNSNEEANVVWLDKPLDAIISPSLGDVDCYWFTTLRPPRDRIAVQVFNHSVTLIPRLRIFDAGGKVLTGLKEAAAPGDSLRFDFSPPANTVYYVQVDGASGTAGAYTLSVNSLRAFDVYEPNDDILSATRFALGQTIDANIMDANDTDFFSFLSPVAAAVTIDIASHSDTLVLGLSTFAPDLRHIGFGPDVKPGGALHHVMNLEANQPYYIQVWAKGDTTGPYTLTIK
jgi:tetratricopeptide (TPR) repeat protein